MDAVAGAHPEYFAVGDGNFGLLVLETTVGIVPPFGYPAHPCVHPHEVGSDLVDCQQNSEPDNRKKHQQEHEFEIHPPYEHHCEAGNEQHKRRAQVGGRNQPADDDNRQDDGHERLAEILDIVLVSGDFTGHEEYQGQLRKVGGLEREVDEWDFNPATGVVDVLPKCERENQQTKSYQPEPRRHPHEPHIGCQVCQIRQEQAEAENDNVLHQVARGVATTELVSDGARATIHGQDAENAQHRQYHPDDTVAS